MSRAFFRARLLILKIARRLGLLAHFNIVVTQQLFGTKIKIPIIYEIGFTNLFVTEYWMVDLVRRLYQIRGGPFIDVGVNLGQTLIKLKCANPDATYIGLEPNSTCVFYVNELIQRNQFTSCTLLPVGLFHRADILQLNFISDSDVGGTASLITDFRAGSEIKQRKYVPVFNFDAIEDALTLSEIAVVKIDVEGAELEVLQGLQNALIQHRPILLLEILPVYEVKNVERKRRQDEIEQIVEASDYRIFRILKAEGDGLRGLQELATIGIHSDISQCDYLFMPNEVGHEFVDVYPHVEILSPVERKSNGGSGL